MAKTVLLGDVNERGGRVMGPGARLSSVDSRVVSLVGDVVAPHPGANGKMHIGARTTALPGTLQVTIEGKPVTLVGSIDTCGCRRLIGSSDTGIT